MSNPPPPPGADDPTGSSQPTPPNPYGQPQPAYGAPQLPYGQPPAGGGGFGPYGDAPKKTDGLSIAAFVLSLTFCLSIVGVILGFVGLSRTKDGKRKGRWAAVTAIVVGLAFTAIATILVVFIGIFAASVVTIDEAESGICVNVDDDDSEGVVLTEKECTESHDAQIVYAGDAGDDADALESDTAVQVCIERVDPAIAELFQSGEYELNALLEDPDDVAADDKVVCYMEPADGEKLSEKLG